MEGPSVGIGPPLPAAVTVVVPTFVERENVAPLVASLERALAGIRWEVVFVDDDSPDGTADAVRAIARLDPRVRVLQRIGSRGLSGAFVDGALSSAAPVVAVMDADLQHDETALPGMLKRLEEERLDLVVASRYAEGGSTTGWDERRRTLSRLAIALARAVIHVPLEDPMSGFFVIRREALDPVVRRLSREGFKILLDILASSPGPLAVAEVPCRFGVRRRGASKLDSLVAWQLGILVVDKLVGRWLPVRFVLFCLVGGVGVLVHLAALRLLLGAGLAFRVAQEGAVLVAMTSNFVLNNLFTYRDRRLSGLAFVRGLLSFYLLCSVGAAANVGVGCLLFAARPTWWLAGVAGAAVGAVWNFVATSLFTWRESRR